MVEEVAGSWPMGSIERFRFYEEARACVAVFATLERRPYANMILTKGVLGPGRRRGPAGAADPPAARPAAREPASAQGPGERQHERAG